MGISLWLVPTAIQAVKLNRVMQIKSSTAKSPSSFVDFEPHLTLATIPASTTSTSDLRASIPDGQTVLPTRFRSVDVGEKYFMSVYAVVHENEGLARLRAHLREKLGHSAVPPVPHLSLYYIDDADRDQRIRVAQELRDTGRVIDRPGDGVSLNCAEVMGEGSEEGFEGEAIWIVRCEGPVPEWEVLEKITLV